MTFTPPPYTASQTPSPPGGNKPQTLLVTAGGVLVASSLLTVALAIYGDRSSQPEVILQRLFTFVSQFPSLLLGFCLLFLGREGRTEDAGWNWRLLRLGPLLLMLLYLATIPAASVLQQAVIDRLEARLGNVQMAGRNRGIEIMADLGKLNSTQAILASLRTYPEISDISLPPASTPDQARQLVATAIRDGLAANRTEGRKQIDAVAKAQGGLTLTIMLNAALATVGFFLVSSRLMPWVDNVRKLLTGAGGGVVKMVQSTMRNFQRDVQRSMSKPAAPSNRQPRPVRRGPGIGERLAKDIAGLESGIGKLLGRNRPKGSGRR